MMKILLSFLILINALHADSIKDFVLKEATIVEKKLNLIREKIEPIGSNEGFSFSYIVHQKMTMKEARLLLTGFVSELQRRTKLFKFSKKSKGDKSIIFNLTSMNKKGKYFAKDGLITRVSLEAGQLMYYTLNAESQFILDHDESYDDAVDINFQDSFLKAITPSSLNDGAVYIF